MGKKRKKDKKSKGKVRVFVYGTLKKKCGNDILLKDAEFLGYDSITGAFGMLNTGFFPAVTENPEKVKGAYTVYGEVYAIDEETLAACDHLEGHPDWFERKKFRTDELDVNVWMYVAPWDWTRRYQFHAPPIWRPKEEEVEVWMRRGVTLSG